jgi:hypothetical protein
MIGFNGGLIGVEKESVRADTIPGVWTANEQNMRARAGKWSGISSPVFKSSDLLDVIYVQVNSSSQAINLTNLQVVLNSSVFQSRSPFQTERFHIRGATGAQWSFSWENLDLSLMSALYIRVQRVGGTNVSFSTIGDFTNSGAGGSVFSNVEFTYTFSAASGSGYINIANNSNGLIVHNIAVGGPNGIQLVEWTP